MRVDIAKLSEDRETVLSERWDSKDFELDVPGRQYQEPLRIEAHVKRNSGIVEARIHAQAALALTCARCFKEFSSVLDKTFSLIYPIDLAQRFIYLDDNIREELILDSPHKILCKEDCMGLCVKCGIDLNEGACKCKRN